MKTLLCLVAGWFLAACIASASPELSPVSFVVGQQHFNSGDSIVIDQVIASSPNFKVGTKVLVCGHYRLASRQKARIGLFVTHRSSGGADSSAASQVVPVAGASGSFELSCDITYDGDPHVSFYSAYDGKSFGGVYFSAPTQKS